MSLSPSRIKELEQLAFTARLRVLQMAAHGGCFVGAALSCVDILAYLYAEVLRVTPRTLDDSSRDYFLLSKGHAVPAQYAVLAELGFFEASRLERHLSTEDDVYWHPNRAVPGVEFQSGSLGHSLSVGIGIALDARRAGDPCRVFVLLGDGELNEGSIWEGLLVARAQALGNLVLIVDRNRLQANVETEALVPLEPLSDKLRAFGALVSEVDGHSFEALAAALAALPSAEQRPIAIIANTVRGKGVPSLEGRTNAWFVHGSPALIEELNQNRGPA
ncbi:MAG TPA: thiamine pyrophosphate-dependent enzyme [Polyangiaceae bacterium]|nr:thiamine pyrophosphate-dependent enzyme [Polyangiaceae bacterium]